MSTERIIIMGVNAKKNNYCVAGLSCQSGKWIRPISNNSAIEEAVEQKDIIYPDGSQVKTLDVVEIHFLDEPSSNLIQPENFYYDSRYQWERVGQASLEKVINWRGYDHRDNIFYNVDRKVEADYVESQADRESLLLLPITDLTIKVERWDNYPKFYAHFRYNGKKYWRFSVGDISVREKFKTHENGEYSFRNKVVAIFSLTNPYSRDNKCYKMLAHVF